MALSLGCHLRALSHYPRLRQSLLVPTISLTWGDSGVAFLLLSPRRQMGGERSGMSQQEATRCVRHCQAATVDTVLGLMVRALG